MVRENFVEGNINILLEKEIEIGQVKMWERKWKGGQKKRRKPFESL